MINIWPITDKEFEAYVLLQGIAKLMSVDPSPYGPENRLREENIKQMKEKYLKLIDEIYHL